MQTLEKTLRLNNSWAIDRIHTLCKDNDFDDIINAYSILSEFAEFLDPNTEHQDIVSLEYIEDEDV
tara:strand:+ start:74 stop:271 length:198 start_codon:yes stop_codon:yes gene_type:complete